MNRRSYAPEPIERIEPAKVAPTPSEVTKIYNARQETVGLVQVRWWVPEDVLVKLRRQVEAEKLEYLLFVAEDAEDGDERLTALASRNIAVPMKEKELEGLYKLAQESPKALATEMATWLQKHEEAAEKSTRYSLEAQLAERLGEMDRYVRCRAKAVAYGYFVRHTRAEVMDLVV